MNDIISALLMIIGGIGMGYCIGHYSNEDAWETECIKRGLARYNETTGEWEWIDSRQN